MILFNELDFKTFTQIAINKAIEKVNDADILHTDLKEEANKIINDLTFTVPVIDKANISLNLSMEDDTGKSFADNNIDLKNNDILATAIYTVPFVGNAEIFKIKPLEYQVNNHQFTIENSNLKFKIRTNSENLVISEECKSHLVSSSFEIISFIESNLQQLAVSFKEFKNEITGPVITSLKERKEELLKAEEIAKEINVFNGNSEAQ